MTKYQNMFFTQDTHLFAALSRILEDEGPEELVEYLLNAGIDEDGEFLDHSPAGDGDHLYPTSGGIVVSYRPSLGYIGVHKQEVW